MTPATDATKTTLENTVTWYLSEKMAAAGTTIATGKYMTNDNRLIYLTRCAIAAAMVPLIKVQILERVDAGVHETGYQLYSDGRLERYQTAMIFGTAPAQPDTKPETVSEDEAAQLVALVTALQTSARALV